MTDLQPYFATEADVEGTDPSLFINEMVVRLGREHKAMRRRRAEVRFPLGLPVSLATRLDEQGTLRRLCEAWAIDFSYEGIGLLTECDLMAGRFLYVQIDEAARATVNIPAMVVFCRPILSRTYRCGLRFQLAP